MPIPRGGARRTRRPGRHCAYPFTSRMRLTVPVDVFLTERTPPVRPTRTLFARLTPGLKLMVFVPGAVPLPGYTITLPFRVASGIVALTEPADAVPGSEHVVFVSVKERVAPAESDGPPSGPFALRVSTMRQGVTV